MTPTEMRDKLHQQIDQLPSDLLLLVADFLEFIKFKRNKATDTSKVSAQSSVPSTIPDESKTPTSTGADLLQFSGTWQGDDFEACLQAVYENRTPTEF